MFAFHQLVVTRRNQIAFPHGYFGTAHAGRIDLPLMQTFLAGAGSGVTEICLHPGAPAPSWVVAECDAGWHDPLAAGRSAELSLLTSPELVNLLLAQQIRLSRLTDLAAHRPASAAA
jgi:hypothetical protein